MGCTWIQALDLPSRAHFLYSSLPPYIPPNINGLYTKTVRDMLSRPRLPHLQIRSKKMHSKGSFIWTKWAILSEWALHTVNCHINMRKWNDKETVHLDFAPRHTYFEHNLPPLMHQFTPRKSTLRPWAASPRARHSISKSPLPCKKPQTNKKPFSST